MITQEEIDRAIEVLEAHKAWLMENEPQAHNTIIAIDSAICELNGYGIKNGYKPEDLEE